MSFVGFLVRLIIGVFLDKFQKYKLGFILCILFFGVFYMLMLVILLDIIFYMLVEIKIFCNEYNFYIYDCF